MVRKTNGQCARVPAAFVGDALSPALADSALRACGRECRYADLPPSPLTHFLMITELPDDKLDLDPRRSSIVMAIVVCAFFIVAACSAEPEAKKPASARSAVSVPRGSAPAQVDVAVKTIPGDFDYWLIALSWSPSWCEFNPGNREQCGNRGFGFVLHGLWPQYERGGGPRDCRSRTRVPERTIDRSMGFMPSRGLVIHEWRTHGSCTTLDPDDYFGLADQAFASVRIPPALRAPRSPPQLSARDVSSAFADANPGLASNAVQVVCTGKQLSEVRICVDADLSTRACGKLSRSRCPAGVLRIPSVR